MGPTTASPAATTLKDCFVATAIALLVLLSPAVQAAGFTTTKQALDFGNQVILDISQMRLDDAWRKMKAYSTIPAAGIDNFGRQYRAHHQQTLRHYGPAVGVELMKTEMAGSAFMRATYLVKYETTALTWFMIFYKVRTSWLLNEFNYDILSNANFIVTHSETATPTGPLLSDHTPRDAYRQGHSPLASRTSQPATSDGRTP